MWCGLCGSPCIFAHAMPVDVEKAEDAVIEEEHVEVSRDRTEGGLHPVGTVLDERISTSVDKAVELSPGAFS